MTARDEDMVARDQPTDLDEVADPRTGARESGNGALLSDSIADDFRTRWESIQAAFVDEPRSAVADADGLVGEVMDRLRATFEDQRQGLEADWGEAEVDATTEDLRVAFRRYRSFFERLLRT